MHRPDSKLWLLQAMSLALAATPAVAQQQTAATELEEVVITGSRIRGVAPVGSSVVAVERDEVLQSGATTTADVLKQIPQITAIGFNAEGSVGPAAPSNITRSTAPNLRGIGPTATLTIFDGHRVSASGTMGQLVDPSFLPPLALERVEVVADGASAIYGSDAVAGVINLVPRKQFDGVEVSVRGGAADAYHDYQIGAIGGTAWDSGRVVVAADYLFSDAVEAWDRDYITNDRRSFGGANGLDINCGNPGTMTVGGVTYALPDGDGRNVLRSQLTPGSRNLCDAARWNGVLPEMERTSIYGSIEQDLTSNLKLVAQGFFSRRTFETVRTQPNLNIANVPATNPFRPADIPAGTPVTVNYSLVPDVGRGPATGEAETYQAIVGLDAVFGDFEVNFSGSYGEGSDYEERRTVNQFYMNQALADPNPATALNVFGGPGSNNPETLARIFSGVGLIAGTSTLKNVEVNANGPLFDMPGGSVRIAVGAEYREEDLEADSRGISAATGQATRTGTSNDRDVSAVYGELFVPIVGGSNAIAGVQSLDLSLAARFEDYSDFGSTTNPKIGLNWRPIDDLLVRASYGTSFRAPGLSENDPNASGAGLYPGNVTLRDGRSVYRVSIAGGNPTLKPEEATTWSFGFDLTPAALPGMRLGVTYFDIEYENQIVDGFGRANLYVNDPDLYPSFVAFQGDPNFAALQSLIQNSGFTSPTPIDYTRPDLVLVDARRVNVGQVKTDGIDVDFRQDFITDAMGTFTVGLSGTRFLSYDTAEGGAYLDRLNTIAFPAKFSGRGNLGWNFGDFTSRLTVHYVTSYSNTNSVLVPKVDDYTTVDLDFSYTLSAGFADGMRLGLNVRNVFDTDPPEVDMAGAYDASKASALGRVFALTVSKRW